MRITFILVICFFASNANAQTELKKEVKAEQKTVELSKNNSNEANTLKSLTEPAKKANVITNPKKEVIVLKDPKN